MEARAGVGAPAATPDEARAQLRTSSQVVRPAVWPSELGHTGRVSQPRSAQSRRIGCKRSKPNPSLAYRTRLGAGDPRRGAPFRLVHSTPTVLPPRSP